MIEVRSGFLLIAFFSDPFKTGRSSELGLSHAGFGSLFSLVKAVFHLQFVFGSFAGGTVVVRVPMIRPFVFEFGSVWFIHDNLLNDLCLQ